MKFACPFGFKEDNIDTPCLADIDLCMKTLAALPEATTDVELLDEMILRLRKAAGAFAGIRVTPKNNWSSWNTPSLCVKDILVMLLKPDS